MRKTKIICTMGPANDDENILRRLILGGMNAARFNFSHSTHKAHKEKLELLTRLRNELGMYIPTILDTRGPEVRVKVFEKGKVDLKKDDFFTLTTRDITGDENSVSVTCANLPQDVKQDAMVLLDDGLVAMRVCNITETDIECRVLNNGTISNNKGINLPGTKLSMPYISEKDHSDILFGIENDFDFIAASFVRSADDILEIRRILEQNNGHNIRIIAKIENMEGVNNIDDILRVADGLMVARGDMGVEIPLEEVPVLQKMMIKKVYKAGKMVITATQMLDSMMNHPRPTRAEATDVANAIYDGTSAIMLSGETAAGKYPVEALETMVTIAERAECDIDYVKRFRMYEMDELPDITNAISHATCTTANDLGAKAIVTVTKSGRTARMVSKYRPPYPIVGCSQHEKICRQLNLSWGVIPVLVEEKQSTDDLFEHAVEAAHNVGVVDHGDLVVITAGIPLGVSGTTNLLKVHVVGHVLVSGKGIGTRLATANLCVCQDAEEAKKNFKDGDILVIPQTDNSLIPLLRTASGLITEQGGNDSHGAITAMAMDLPTVIGVENATYLLRSGAVVTLDAERGIVTANRDAKE